MGVVGATIRRGRYYFLRVIHILCAALFIVSLFSLEAYALRLVSYHAVYRVDSIDGGAPLEGRLVEERRGGETCFGYVKNSRLVLYGDSSRSVVDERESSFEAFDASRFSSYRSRYENGELHDNISLQAFRDYRDGEERIFVRSGNATFKTLSAQVLFPTQLLKHLIEDAYAGKKEARYMRFDVDRSQEQSIVVLFSSIAAATKDAMQATSLSSPKDHPLRAEHGWYFSLAAFNGFKTVKPSFFLQGFLFGNGIEANKTFLDGFRILHASLKTISYLPLSNC